MKPNKLPTRLRTANVDRVATLGQKAGSSARPRGRAWMTQRERIAARDGYVCAFCGLVWQPELDQVDHIIELEDGGSNDDSNLQLLCNACHATKTRASALARRG